MTDTSSNPIDRDQQEQPSLLSHALKWGFISGAIGILFFVILYVVDYSFLVQFKFLLLALFCTLAIVSYGAVEYRKALGGYLSYGKAWQVSYVTLVVSGITYTLFSMLMYFVIDTELPDKLVEASLDNARQMMENFGAPADQIDTEVEKARARTENQFTPGGMAMNFGIQLVIYTILALITALFGRKNPPVDQM